MTTYSPNKILNNTYKRLELALVDYVQKSKDYNPKLRNVDSVTIPVISRFPLLLLLVDRGGYVSIPFKDQNIRRVYKEIGRQIAYLKLTDKEIADYIDWWKNFMARVYGMKLPKVYLEEELIYSILLESDILRPDDTYEHFGLYDIVITKDSEFAIKISNNIMAFLLEKKKEILELKEEMLKQKQQQQQQPKYIVVKTEEKKEEKKEEQVAKVKEEPKKEEKKEVVAVEQTKKVEEKKEEPKKEEVKEEKKEKKKEDLAIKIINIEDSPLLQSNIQWYILFKSISAYTPLYDEDMGNVPLLRVLQGERGGFEKKNVFFLYIDPVALREYISKFKVHRRKEYVITNQLSDEEAIKVVIRNILANLFGSSGDERKFYLLSSIALNLILYRIYKYLLESVEKKEYVFDTDLYYNNFYEAVMRSMYDSLKQGLREIVQKLNYIYIVPKDIFEAAKISDVNVVKGDDVFIESERSLAIKSHHLFKCNSCGLYFVGDYEEEEGKDPTTGKTITIKKPPKCIFCGSDKTVSLENPEKQLYEISLKEYNSSSGVDERVFMFEDVGYVVGPNILLKKTPIVFIPFPKTEKRARSPLERKVNMIVGLVDIYERIDEKEFIQSLESARKKILKYEDPMQRLILLAKSVNAASESDILRHVDYGISANLIALATATNKNIVLVKGKGEEITKLSIKPSLNVLMIGESASGKSTLSVKLEEVFPERVFATSLFRYTSRQLSGYVGVTLKRRSVFLGYIDRYVIFDEATNPRDEEVYSALRNLLENGQIDRDNVVNTAIAFIANDPLGINLTEINKSLFRYAIDIASRIKDAYGEYHNVLKGLYSLMIIPVIATAVTRPFIERMRMFIITRSIDKIKNILFSFDDDSYITDIKTLKREGKLLDRKELEALFERDILPITGIIVPEDVQKLASRYAIAFYTIFRLIGREIESLLENKRLGSSVTYSSEISAVRIEKALILIASGIAKLTRFNEAKEIKGVKWIVLKPSDIELAKKFFITYIPDQLHILSSKQLEDVIKFILEKYDKKELGSVDFSTIDQIASQAIVSVEEFSIIEDSIQVTDAVIIDVLYESLREALAIKRDDIPFSSIVDSIIKRKYANIRQDKYNELMGKVLDIVDNMKNTGDLVMSNSGVVVEFNRRDVLTSKNKFRTYISIFMKDLV